TPLGCDLKGPVPTALVEVCVREVAPHRPVGSPRKHIGVSQARDTETGPRGRSAILGRVISNPHSPGRMTMNPSLWHRSTLAVVLIVGLSSIARPAHADDATEARQLVEKAQLTFESMIAAPEMDGLRDLIKKARGVLVAPQVLRGAFIVGASGGSGVFFAR